MTNQNNPLLPRGFVVREGAIFREVRCESTTTDVNGEDISVTAIDFDFVCPRELYIVGITREVFGVGSLTCYVGDGTGGYKKQSLPLCVAAESGTFSSWLNYWGITASQATHEKIRIYVMDCAMPLVERAVAIRQLREKASA